MTKSKQQLAAFVFGVVFVAALLAIAIVIKTPSDFQYEVFKVVLALAAAGVAAMIPGFLSFEISKVVRAGGAMAVFAIVYFNSPARMITQSPEPDPTSLFPIIVSCVTQESVTLNSFSFPYSDIKQNDSYDGMRKLLSQLPNQQCDQAGAHIYRIKDEAKLLQSSSLTATAKNNVGVIVMSKDVIDALGGDEHIAFTKINTGSVQ